MELLKKTLILYRVELESEKNNNIHNIPGMHQVYVASGSIQGASDLALCNFTSDYRITRIMELGEVIFLVV